MSLYVYEGYSYAPWGYRGNLLDVISFDRPYIHNIEEAFWQYGVTDIETMKKVIQKVEKGTLVNRQIFCDRFGTYLDVGKLSASSKALLLLAECKDKVLNFNSVGDLARELALTWFREGFLYMDRFYGGIRYDAKIDVVVNGRKHYAEGREFNAEWWF